MIVVISSKDPGGCEQWRSPLLQSITSARIDGRTLEHLGTTTQNQQKSSLCHTRCVDAQVPLKELCSEDYPRRYCTRDTRTCLWMIQRGLVIPSTQRFRLYWPAGRAFSLPTCPRSGHEQIHDMSSPSCLARVVVAPQALASDKPEALSERLSTKANASMEVRKSDESTIDQLTRNMLDRCVRFCVNSHCTVICQNCS